MMPIIPAARGGGGFLDSLLGGAAQAAPAAIDAYFTNQKEQKQKAERDETVSRLIGQNARGLTPEMQVEMLRGKNKLAEFQAEQAQKLRSEQTKQQQEDAALRQLESDRNLEPGSLNAYKGNLNLAEKSTRPMTKTQASQPIDPQQMAAIEKARAVPGYDTMDETQQYRELQRAGVSRENAEAEAKLTGQQLTRQGQSFDKSYEAQKDFIEDTTNRYRSFETEMKPKLLQMQAIPDEDLIGPTEAVFLETMGIPLGALKDPSSELYQKLSLDLMKGLPETYGNRILKVEVDNFLKTIPQLINSPDGRRMIASNMLKLGEMKEVYYNAMRRTQKEHLENKKDLPKDFQQNVFDQVKPQIDRINNEFVKLQEIKSVPKGTVPFFDPSGEISFVPMDQLDWATANGGRRIW